MCDNLASLHDAKNEFIAICPSFDANQQYHVYGKTFGMAKEITISWAHVPEYAMTTIKPI